jgi:hypothetical protein
MNILTHSNSRTSLFSELDLLQLSADPTTVAAAQAQSRQEALARLRPQLEKDIRLSLSKAQLTLNKPLDAQQISNLVKDLSKRSKDYADPKLIETTLTNMVKRSTQFSRATNTLMITAGTIRLAAGAALVVHPHSAIANAVLQGATITSLIPQMTKTWQMGQPALTLGNGLDIGESGAAIVLGEGHPLVKAGSYAAHALSSIGFGHEARKAQIQSASTTTTTLLPAGVDEFIQLNPHQGQPIERLRNAGRVIRQQVTQALPDVVRQIRQGRFGELLNNSRTAGNVSGLGNAFIAATYAFGGDQLPGAKQLLAAVATASTVPHSLAIIQSGTGQSKLSQVTGMTYALSGVGGRILQTLNIHPELAKAFSGLSPIFLALRKGVH